MTDRDYLNLALAKMHTGQWFGFSSKEQNYSTLIIHDSSIAKPTEAEVNADLLIRYDYEAPGVARPAAYPFDTATVVAIYGSSLYGTATYGGQTNPLIRQPIEGSGFAVALRVNDRGTSAPYSLKGFQLEFDAGARR